MKVIEFLPDSLAKVEAGNVFLTISTKLLEKVTIGDHVIVHAGFAIEVLDAKAAEETKKLLNELAESWT